ncbi:MAG: hypothetical protein JST51_19370 [Armatimonadetes bacterium]|nr:hypothetical protein [Armatimonadota bacterium]
MALLGAIVYGLAPDIKKEMYKKVSDPSIRHTIDTMTQPTGIALIVLAVVYFIFTFFFGIATCQGRKWAIWLHFLLSLPSAVFVVLYGTEGIRFGSGVPIIVAVYCLLRILGAVGPKL